METREAKENFLKERGWKQWHHANYWVHPKLVESHDHKDYTNYGVTLQSALDIEEAEKVYKDFLDSF